jgi:hypothetical protein
MTWPPARKWPGLAALAYALFGLTLFGLSMIEKARNHDDFVEDHTYDTIIDYSYPCASYGTCLNLVDIPFQTAVLVQDHTPLDAYINEKFSEVGFEKKHPVLRFMFTKNYSTLSPYLWLFIILYGCLFYYGATWLLVKGIAWFRKKP